MEMIQRADSLPASLHSASSIVLIPAPITSNIHKAAYDTAFAWWTADWHIILQASVSDYTQTYPSPEGHMEPYHPQ